MGKNRNKALNLSRADNTVLGMIAYLNSPARKCLSAEHSQQVQDLVASFKNVLNGKARRVAECVLDNTIPENNRVINKAHELKSWANNI